MYLEALPPATNRIEPKEVQPALWSRIRTTAAWLDANLAQFDPLPNGFPSYWSIKRFAELSIAVLCLERLSRSSGNPSWLAGLVQRTVDFQTFHCGRPAYHEALVKEPLGAFSFALPYLVLRSMGHRSTRLEAAIDGLLRNGLFLSVEMVPFRALDRLYFLKLGGHPVRARELLSWYRQTTLGARKKVAVFNVDDAYAVTHTIFYMCDFGDRGDGLLNEIETTRATAVLQSLLVHSWRIRNWDLMGETLACVSCLRMPQDDRLVSSATRAYTQRYRADGTMAPDQTMERHQRRLREPNAYFRDCYHSTLVFLLYASMSLRQCNEPNP